MSQFEDDPKPREARVQELPHLSPPKTIPAHPSDIRTRDPENFSQFPQNPRREDDPSS